MSATVDMRGVLFPNLSNPIYASNYPLGNRPVPSAWKLAPAYRADNALPIVASHPRTADADSVAAWRYLTTKVDNDIRLCWQGGEPPYKVEMTTAPAGASIGVAGLVQTFDRTVDSVVTSMYRHTLPSGYATLKIPKTAVVDGQAYTFAITVTDQKDETAVFNFTSNCDNSKFKFFDSVNGSNAAAGTYEAPYQTFVYGHNLSGGNNYIYMFKNGTYSISNGAGGDAVMSTAKPRSFIGIGTSASSVVFDMSSATFSGSVNDFTVKHLKLSGAPASANPKQINVNNQSHRLHVHDVKFDTRVGTDGGDNPCGLFMTDLTSGSYHDYTTLVDSELLSTSTSSMAIYFSCRYGLEENCYANGVVFPQTNGSLVSHQKDSSYSNTYRFNDYSANSDNGIIWVSNQDYAYCANTEILFCRLANVGTGNSNPVRWNGQVHSSPMTRPDGQFAVRNSIISGDTEPYNFENYRPGFDVKFSGTLWSSSTGVTTVDTTGGVSMTTTSVKVSDVNTISSGNLGVRGWVIAST